MSGVFRGMRCNDCSQSRICDYHSSILAAERTKAEARERKPMASVERELTAKPRVTPSSDLYDYETGRWLVRPVGIEVDL